MVYNGVRRRKRATLLLHAREFSLGRVPDLDRVNVRADHVFQMCGHGAAVNLGAGSGLSNALCDLEDDAREAILVDPDFLVVGDLSQFAAERNMKLQVS